MKTFLLQFSATCHILLFYAVAIASLVALIYGLMQVYALIDNCSNGIFNFKP